MLVLSEHPGVWVVSDGCSLSCASLLRHPDQRYHFLGEAIVLQEGMKGALWLPLCFPEEVLPEPASLSDLEHSRFFQGFHLTLSDCLLGAGERMIAG